MYKILVTTNGSEQAKTTIEETIKIAAPMGKDVEVYVAFVMEKIDNMIYAPDLNDKLKKAVEESQDSFSNGVISKAVKQLTEKGIKTHSKILKGNPVDQICLFAEKEKCNLIIMGKRSRGKLEEFFAGSISTQVVQRAKTSVLVLK